MNLACRPMEAADVEPCLSLVTDEYADCPGVFPHAGGVWRRLLAEARLNAMVLEDGSRPPGERFAAFGLSAFVTPEFLADVARGEVPGPAAQVVAHTHRGHSPVLSLDAIRRANSGGGLSLLVLHYAVNNGGLTPEVQAAVRERQPETFLYVHAGYRLREMLREVRDERHVPFLRESGFQIRAERDGRWLTGLTRDEAREHPGRYAAAIFRYTPPCFYFKPHEQDLLRRALLDETDEEIAAALALSPSAVKKRWAAVYARASAVVPALFHEPPEETRSAARRGQEKRRPLLRYLRQHPEELRPAMPPAP